MGTQTVWSFSDDSTAPEKVRFAGFAQVGFGHGSTGVPSHFMVTVPLLLIRLIGCKLAFITSIILGTLLVTISVCAHFAPIPLNTKVKSLVPFGSVFPVPC